MENFNVSNILKKDLFEGEKKIVESGYLNFNKLMFTFLKRELEVKYYSDTKLLATQAFQHTVIDNGDTLTYHLKDGGSLKLDVID